MRLFLFSLLAILLAGCAGTSALVVDAGSPVGVVKRLLPFPNAMGDSPKFTTTAELPTIKSYVTPELYSELWDWAVWCQKAIDAIPEGDSVRMNYQLAPSNNIFIDAKAIDADAPITQKITGAAATVTVTSIRRDKGDGHPVISKTTAVFSLVQSKGAWVVSDVNLSRVNYQPKGTYGYTLSSRLKKNIADFKEKASR